MKLISTDGWALACIGGCAALAVGVTALRFDGPESHKSDCVIEPGTFVTSLSISQNGNVVVVRPDEQMSEETLCASGEDRHRKGDRHKKKRRRHPRHIDQDRVRIRVNMDEARARIDAVRAEAMELQFEAQTRAIEGNTELMELELEGMEEAARALESVMEDEVEARIEEQMRLLEERLKGIGEGAGN